MYKKDYIWIILGGLVIAGDFCLWAWSLQLTSMAHSLLFLCTPPVLLVPISFIMKEKVNKFEIIGVAIGVVGLVLIVLDTDGSNSTWYGDLMAFGAAICITLYMLIGRVMIKGKQYPLFAYLFSINFTGAIFSYIFALLV